MAAFLAMKTDKLSDIIQNDMIHRISCNDKGLENLTLNSLAKFYNVSPMPVRTAVRQLERRRYLIKKANGRLEINPQKLGLKENRDAKTTEQTIESDHQHQIGQLIIQASLIGFPAYLREEAIAEQHGVSRTVIRQIFSQFVGRGMLKHIPRKGWQITSFEKEDMNDYIVLREVLETKALRLAAKHLEEKVLRRFLEGNRPEAGRKVLQIDNSLHHYWIDRSGNRYLQDFFQRTGEYYTCLFDFATLNSSAVSEMASQHCLILEAILANDYSLACKELIHHIQAQKPVLLQTIETLRSSPKSEILS